MVSRKFHLRREERGGPRGSWELAERGGGQGRVDGWREGEEKMKEREGRDLARQTRKGMRQAEKEQGKRVRREEGRKAVEQRGLGGWGENE